MPIQGRHVKSMPLLQVLRSLRLQAEVKTTIMHLFIIFEIELARLFG